MNCRRCLHPLAQMDSRPGDVVFGICIRCGLIRIDYRNQPPWMRNLEQPQAQMAAHVLLQARSRVG